MGGFKSTGELPSIAGLVRESGQSATFAGTAPASDGGGVATSCPDTSPHHPNPTQHSNTSFFIIILV